MWRKRSSAGSHHGRDRGDRYQDANEGDFWIDKEGIPHWNGIDTKHLRQYKARVRLEYEAIIGDTDWAKEKRASLGVRLTRGLTGKAWDAIDGLLGNLDPLKVDGGHKLVVAMLDKLDKAEVLQKQQRFDDFFKRSARRYGQDMSDYIREKERKYNDLNAIDSSTALSDDLYAYFLLEGARLQDAQKKLVTLVADSEFDTQAFSKTLSTNFHDLHLTERRSGREPEAGKFGRHRFGGKGRDRALWAGDSEEEGEEGYSDGQSEESVDEADEVEDETWPSDDGASQDEDLMEAYVSYDQARQNLRTQQRERGFYKQSGGKGGQRSPDEKKAAIAAQKKKSRCGACGQIGHWAGDSECPKKKQFRPKKGGGKGGRDRGRGKGPTHRERVQAEHDRSYFALDDSHEVFTVQDETFAVDTVSSYSDWQTITLENVVEKAKTEALQQARLEIKSCRELKDQLRALRQPVSGLKVDLVARIMRATGGQAYP